MRSYNVIYDIVDDIRALMEGKLASVDERTPIGEGEVRAIFGSGSRIVAGCMITEGMCRKGCHAVVRSKTLVSYTLAVADVTRTGHTAFPSSCSCIMHHQHHFTASCIITEGMCCEACHAVVSFRTALFESVVVCRMSL